MESINLKTYVEDEVGRLLETLPTQFTVAKKLHSTLNIFE
jgi:hypothetical protein